MEPGHEQSSKGAGTRKSVSRFSINLITYRHLDPRYSFLWDSVDQSPGRWHSAGEGPVHYLADTPQGAWAEFLRHEDIGEAQDLLGIERSIWAVEVPDIPSVNPALDEPVLLGGVESYESCRAEARRLRDSGAEGLTAPSAALLPEGATGWVVNGGNRPASGRDGRGIVLFGRRPDLVGWEVVRAGRPSDWILQRIRYLS